MSGEGVTVRGLGWVEQRGWLAPWQLGVCTLEMIPVHNLLTIIVACKRKAELTALTCCSFPIVDMTYSSYPSHITPDPFPLASFTSLLPPPPGLLSP